MAPSSIAPQPQSGGSPGFVYDAFLSYSTTGDYGVARYVESFLEGFHKTAAANAIGGLRSLQVCRDGSDFRLPRRASQSEADDGLWALVEAELRKCRTLIVICSEDSVASNWVSREVQWMLETRGESSVLLAISGSPDPIANPEQIFPEPVRRSKLDRVRVWYDLRALREVVNPRVRDAEDELVRLAGDLLGWDNDRQGSLGAIWLREATRHRRKQARRWTFAGIAMVALGVAATVYAFRATRAAAQARANSIVVAAEASRDPLVSSLLLDEVPERESTNDALRVANDVSAMRIPVSRLFGHTGRVLSLEISADEKSVLSAGADGEVRLWPLTGKGNSRILASYARGATWSGFRDEGATVISGGADGTVTITNLGSNTNRLVHLPLNDLGIKRVESAASAFVALASDGSVWILPRGSSAGQFERLDLPDNDHVLTVCPAEEGFWMLSEAGSVWHILENARHATRDTGLSLSPSEVGEFGVNAIRFAACTGTGDAVAFAGDSMLMLVTPSRHGHALKREQTTAAATSLASSADGRRLVLGNIAGGVSVYQIPSLALVRRFEVNSGFWTNDQIRGEEPGAHPQRYEVKDVVISASGDLVAATYEDWVTRVWHVDGGPTAEEFRGQAGADRLSLSAANHFVLTGADDGSLRVWSLEEKTEPTVLEHPKNLYAMAVDPGEQVLATGDSDGSITLWDLDNTRQDAVLPFIAVANSCPNDNRNISRRIVTLAISSGKEHLLAAYANGALGEWNIKEPVQPRLESVVCLCSDLKTGAAVPGEGALMAACTDGTVSIWQGGTQAVRLSNGPAMEPTALAAGSESGPYIVGYVDGHVITWPDSMSQPVEVGRPAHTAEVLCVGVTHDGRKMLTTSQDGLAKLWRQGSEVPLAQASDLETGKWMENCLLLEQPQLGIIASETGRTWVWSLNGGTPQPLYDRMAVAHVGSILSLAWLSEQGLLATGGGVDGDIRLWHIKTLQPAGRFSPGDGAITGLWPIRKSTQLISIGEDRRARIWSVPWSKVIGALRARTSANLTQVERERLLGETPDQARQAFERAELQQGRSPLPEDFFFRIPF